ncbi:MAG: Holliday junction branch migration protein RuvA [Lachnospiraceae bacterium]|nr:Holliday junction branch migration protein RuvA [Lachnospiraceae bacterium]
MISYIKGSLQEISGEFLIVETGGIGYQIQVPFSMLSEMAVGEEIKVYTYFSMGQDQVPRLYGFSAREDLEVFKLLIGVSGVGPKGAMGVLSAISPEELQFAVLSEDAKTIARAPGVGLKTAKKLILELKDKFKLEEAFERKRNCGGDLTGGKSGALSKDVRGEAVQALTALGYSGAEAMRAVNQVEEAEAFTVEELLKAALRHMTRF